MSAIVPHMHMLWAKMLLLVFETSKNSLEIEDSMIECFELWNLLFKWARFCSDALTDQLNFLGVSKFQRVVYLLECLVEKN